MAKKQSKKVVRKPATKSGKKTAGKTARKGGRQAVHKVTVPPTLSEADFDNCFVHPAATVMGLVRMGECSSVWPGAVIRADLNTIDLGRYVNIQDNSTLHVDSRAPLRIGDYSVIGHNVMVHSCTIGRGVLIGIGAVVLDQAEIGDGAVITAGCLIRGGKKVPPGALVIVRSGETVILENKARPRMTVAAALEYHQIAQRHREGRFGPFPEAEERVFLDQATAILDGWKAERASRSVGP